MVGGEEEIRWLRQVSRCAPCAGGLAAHVTRWTLLFSPSALQPFCAAPVTVLLCSKHPASPPPPSSRSNESSPITTISLLSCQHIISISYIIRTSFETIIILSKAEFSEVYPPSRIPIANVLDLMFTKKMVCLILSLITLEVELSSYSSFGCRQIQILLVHS